MDYLAHSAKDGYQAQTYRAHVEGVCSLVSSFADELEQYATKSHGIIKAITYTSAMWHDLGKLDDQNQLVLHDTLGIHRHLPINHVDAGSAKLIRENAWYEALMVYSHHRGLPDMAKEYGRESSLFRDYDLSVRAHTDKTFQELIKRHNNEIYEVKSFNSSIEYSGNRQVLLRMLLSCLADADHINTAAHYGQAPQRTDVIKLRANERLSALDLYVSTLGCEDERSLLRSEMYNSCRNAKINSNFTVCDSPVGSGKTTAVMAHLLKQALERKAKRIFVVLPYTSIIQQSVEVYRKALVLPGEDPEMVVAELHCRADFQDKDTRYLTALWQAPIVVTTAVAFFETLASNRPSTLRRLHNLPGSVIFVDESHNALPTHLLPLTWKWMNVLAEDWSCYWILASGSIVRFWSINAWKERIELAQPEVSELVHESLRKRLYQYENRRIAFRWRPEPLSRKMLINWIASMPGPRLLIINTIQSAAVIAEDLRLFYGREKVEHLSSALSPADRDKTIKRVTSRLKNSLDTDWTLVATSCVEAGVDFSFRSGFRELSSLLSLLQAAGRVNRHGLFKDAEIWSFVLQDDSRLKSNPALNISRMVLQDYFKRDMCISPKLSTRSMNDEITRNDSCIPSIKDLLDDEKEMQFKVISEKYQVIASDMAIAIVDDDFADEVVNGEGNWQQLQRKCVSIPKSKIQKWKLKEVAVGIYLWTLPYNSFIGYMKGVLDTERDFN
jgi:CRISPR/Cas system-associated endonuclease/helicase Cas3